MGQQPKFTKKLTPVTLQPRTLDIANLLQAIAKHRQGIGVLLGDPGLRNPII
jgi:hypothetical protein